MRIVHISQLKIILITKNETSLFEKKNNNNIS